MNTGEQWHKKFLTSQTLEARKQKGIFTEFWKKRKKIINPEFCTVKTTLQKWRGNKDIFR